MAALGLLVFVAVASLLAPVYAHLVAHVNPFPANVQGTIRLGGKTVSVLQPSSVGFGVTPIGPTWNFSTYFLGADPQGRDVFARLLYGGRISLLISFSAAVICCVIAAILGMAGGYFGGAIDWVVSSRL